MEVFMLTLQLFAAGYAPDGETIHYNARQTDTMAQCYERGEALTVVTTLEHGDKSVFHYKCILRQGT